MSGLQKFTWNAQRERAALMVAENALTDELIAHELGITRMALWKWKAQPVFQERVAGIVEATRAAVLAEGIANKQNRVRAQNDRWLRMQQVIAERATDPDMRAIPGGTTGLLVHQVKGVGRGEDFQVVDEYAVDTGLLRELREHEATAARELGQLVDETTASGPSVVRVYVGVQVNDGNH